MISQAMVARKPGSPGRARNKSKNHRAGNAGALAIPVVTMLVYFLLLYTGPRVWPKHPAFPAPSVEGDKDSDRTRPRECKACRQSVASFRDGAQAPDPESRDSGSPPSRRPE